MKLPDSTMWRSTMMPCRGGWPLSSLEDRFVRLSRVSQRRRAKPAGNRPFGFDEPPARPTTGGSISSEWEFDLGVITRASTSSTLMNRQQCA